MPLQEVTAGNSRALQDIADAITKSHKVLVITGAGISTNCGIPDFRSKDGIYNVIPAQSILPTPPSSQPSTPSRKRKASATDDEDDETPSSQSSTLSRNMRRSSNSPASRMKGQDLFHARVFQNPETTEVFYQFIASLRQKIHKDVTDTSATHKFIRVLRDGGRLMRCYTQNIDGLEHREGLCLDLTRGKGNKRRFMKKYCESPRPEQIKGTDFDGGCEVVQLHGELTKLRCTMCSVEEEWTDKETPILLGGFAPNCTKCVEKSDLRQATGKRGLTVGALRPNIVLYGEEHPQNTLLSPFVPYDMSSNPDILIIMGTSLKVHGLQKIIRDFAKVVHERKHGRVIFVNRTRPAESVWDGIIDDFVAMDCDLWVKDLKTRREDLWQRQGEINLKLAKEHNEKDKLESVKIHEDRGSATPSKRVKVKHNPGLTVDIPPWDYEKNHLASRPTQTRVSEPETPSKATKWRKSSKAGVKGALSSLAQTIATPQAHSSNKFTLENELPEENIESSPVQPGFSPVTPSFTPINMTPRSTRRSVAGTPSKLRITTLASVNEEVEGIIPEHEVIIEDNISEDTQPNDDILPHLQSNDLRADSKELPNASRGVQHRRNFIGRILASSALGAFRS